MILKTASGRIICQDLKFCESFIDMTLGLLRNSNPRNLMFKTRFGIHTFFLKDSIDIVILNQDFRIVKIKRALTPNRFLFWNPLFDLVLELKEGTIGKYKLELDDLVVIK